MTGASGQPGPGVPGLGVSERWAEWRRRVDLDKYDSRWQAMADRGESVHGEADFVDWLIETLTEPNATERVLRVLDAGCGTGRLAIELTRRGYRTLGVDLDPDMVERAGHKAPDLRWRVGDLAELDLGETFEVAVMAGNIPLFCAPGVQAGIIASIARHLGPGGLLVCGWSQETRPDAYLVKHLERDAADAGMETVHRFSTWDRGGFDPGGDYAVIVARRG